MTRIKQMAIVAALAGAAACGKAPPAQQQSTDAFIDNQDLSAVQHVDSAAALSAAEANRAAADSAAKAAAAPAPAAATPVKHTATATHHHRATSSGSSGSSGTVAAAPHRATVKHTRRDAVIGGVAGAGIGAIAGGSHHRVKGAVIGGAAGAIAGAVIGNNVDKTHH